MWFNLEPTELQNPSSQNRFWFLLQSKYTLQLRLWHTLQQRDGSGDRRLLKKRKRPLPPTSVNHRRKKYLTRRQEQRLLIVFIITRQHVEKKPKLSLVGFYPLGLHPSSPWLLHGTHSCVNTSNFLHQRSFLHSRDHSLFCHIHNWQEIKIPHCPVTSRTGSRTSQVKGTAGVLNSHTASGIFSEYNRILQQRLYKLQTLTFLHHCQPDSLSSMEPTGSSSSLLNQHTIDMTWGGQYTVSKHAKQVIMPHDSAKCIVSKYDLSSRNYKTVGEDWCGGSA